ncbi:hypothetical protein TSIB_0491 [Thermococcus sibiricus MM 739]|uniref:Uncharacterized protein n=1 Tax=Thermococcus sibiricus (strain DSM 12597 / MM 739) TaxID=604354 RepID=C6A1R2_THESM|nr:hypothetical protein TSIB_0491 [Thermococcus sibiricus MM 739]
MYFENLSFELRRELVGIAYRSWILLFLLKASPFRAGRRSVVPFPYP